MKYINTIIITILSLFIINSCCDTTGPEGTGLFLDPNFEKAIRFSLDKPKGEITTEDLELILQVTNFNHNIPDNNNKISNISGIEYCKNVEGIDLIGNNIIDFEPIKNLVHLRYLRLENNNLYNINSFKGPINLAILDIGDNSITNIDSLSNLENLKILNIPNNNVQSISPLANLNQLHTINAVNNKISKISQLPTQINHLELGYNNLSDIEILSKYDLYYLALNDNNISDIKPLVENSYFENNNNGTRIIELYNNPLNQQSKTEYIPILEDWGIIVYY